MTRRSISSARGLARDTSQHTPCHACRPQAQAITFLQHPDQHRPEDAILLQVDQQLGDPMKDGERSVCAAWVGALG